MAINNVCDINLKELIERETGKKFNRQGKITCPFHSEKTPSLSIRFNPNMNKEQYRCFGCGATGDSIDFVRNIKGLDYNQARQYLGLPVENSINEQLEDKLKGFIGWQINKTDYRKGHELTGIFPFVDSDNNILYFKAKFLKPDGSKDMAYYHIDNDKVVCSRGADEVPYNLYRTLQAIKDDKVIVICEGEKDANTINSLFKGKGCEATSIKGVKDLSVLEDARIYVCGDTGQAGEEYKRSIYNSLFPSAKVFKFINLPGLEELGDNKDVTDWIEAGKSKNDLRNAFKKSLDLKLDEDIKAYDFTDLGIAKRFKDRYRDIAKYSVDSKTYYIWNGRYWGVYDDDLLLKTLFNSFVDSFEIKINEYIRHFNEDEKEKINAFKNIVKKLKSDKVLNAAVKRYKTFEDTHVKSSIFDREVKYINCKNGVIDTLTGELKPHDKDLLITKYTDVDYKNGIVNQLYKSAVARLFKGDKEEIEAFELLIGYMLSGKANQKSFPIICGAKDSGKTLIFEIIKSVLGDDYVKVIGKNVLMRAWDKSANADPEVAELDGIRLLMCSETNDTDYLNNDFIKKITGGDTIKARPLYKSPIEYKPIFVPVIFTNDKPILNGNDKALVERLIIIELLYPLSKDEIDKDFKNHVLENKEGVFSYLIDCIVKFNKKGELLEPKRWKDGLEQYALENNIYLIFKNEWLYQLDGHIILANEVYEKFEQWYIDNYSKNVPSKIRLTKELEKLGIKRGNPRNGYPTYKDISMYIINEKVKETVSFLYPIK